MPPHDDDNDNHDVDADVDVDADDDVVGSHFPVRFCSVLADDRLNVFIMIR